MFAEKKKLCISKLSSIEDNETSGPLLVHDPVAALPAPDGIPGSDLILAVALPADVDHGSLRLSSLLVSMSSLHGKLSVSEILNICYI